MEAMLSVAVCTTCFHNNNNNNNNNDGEEENKERRATSDERRATTTGTYKKSGEKRLIENNDTRNDVVWVLDPDGPRTDSQWQKWTKYVPWALLACQDATKWKSSVFNL